MVYALETINFDKIRATIDGYTPTERRLSQLQDVFADQKAYEALLRTQNDPMIYSVTSVQPAQGDGQLHFGIGKLMPGCVGDEYFMTRGHFHEWRDAAEVYIGLSGTGIMLMEDEHTDKTWSAELKPDSVVYVPGYTAHRTVNIGDTPLTYLGIYPAQAGHDYGALNERNFKQVVVAQNGTPVILERKEFLRTLS